MLHFDTAGGSVASVEIDMTRHLCRLQHMSVRRRQRQQWALYSAATDRKCLDFNVAASNQTRRLPPGTCYDQSAFVPLPLVFSMAATAHHHATQTVAFIVTATAPHSLPLPSAQWVACGNTTLKVATVAAGKHGQPDPRGLHRLAPRKPPSLLTGIALAQTNLSYRTCLA